MSKAFTKEDDAGDDEELPETEVALPRGANTPPEIASGEP